MGPPTPKPGHSDHRPWLLPRCRLGANDCRGNYPRILQGLLGAEVIVRNYGMTGRSVDGYVPRQCYRKGLNDTVLHNVSFEHVIQDLVSARQLRNTDECNAALLKTPHFRELAAFRPHVAVLLMGTNDALNNIWTAGRYSSGRIGYVQGIASLIYGLWHTTNVGPSVLVLEPPLTMSDQPRSIFAAPGCMRMHNCRYHPSLPCWSIAECITCSDRDRLDSDNNDRRGPGNPFQQDAHKSCVRLDGLRALRSSLQKLLFDLRHRVKAEHDATAMAPRSNGDGALKRHSMVPYGAATSACPVDDVTRHYSLSYVTSHMAWEPNWRLFSGVYHLSAAGSAMLACTVYEAMAAVPCGRPPCIGSSRNGTSTNGTSAADVRVAWLASREPTIGANRSLALLDAPPLYNEARSMRFCAPLLAAARGEAGIVAARTLDYMEEALFHMPKSESVG